ncbi:DsrE family protein [Mucilaginibacter sp.]|uniref:DsrE family protein n=1 Tax=Mucilaginibacter sp. TaxID=1882438 RepID=UPI003D128DD8
MKTHLSILIALALLAFAKPVHAQADTTLAGATAKLSHYDALYILNSGDDHKIQATLHFIANALEDRRLKGKLHIELIAYSTGVNIYKKSGPYEKQLKELYDKGVVFAECNNTVVAMNISRNDLFPFVVYVPSGNGEIILRHYDGWAVVQPTAY